MADRRVHGAAPRPRLAALGGQWLAGTDRGNDCAVQYVAARAIAYSHKPRYPPGRTSTSSSSEPEPGHLIELILAFPGRPSPGPAVPAPPDSVPWPPRPAS